MFHWRNGPMNVKNELKQWITQYQGMCHGSLPVIVGLVDGRNAQFIRDGTDFLYGDHAYFNRGWDNGNFRVVRGGHHQTKVFKRPDDRLKKLGVQIEPWRKRGRNIVVIPPSTYYETIYGLGGWTERTVGQLRELTERKVHVKSGKGNLPLCLLEEQDAWAVVCCISVAGMEAALMGVPVFSTHRCCSWPVNAGPLENIESPEYPERHEWACSLTYASWNVEDLETIDFLDYQYALKEAICAS
jgi:hypothetical protein